jgi:DNA-directed RNA polymerase specialized sigma24 family protein
MLRDVLAELTDALYAYQRQPDAPGDEERMGQALERVLAQRVRPILARRLRPGDIEDTLGEIRLACWRYRMSIRAEDVGRFIHAVAQRKLADTLRGYYREAELAQGDNPDGSSRLDLLAAGGSEASGAQDQAAWELLEASGLGDVDVLVAYLVFTGVAKGEIARALGISPNTVTNALKRCQQQLLAARQASAGGRR